MRKDQRKLHGVPRSPEVSAAIALSELVTPAPADAHIALEVLVRHIEKQDALIARQARQLGAQHKQLRIARKESSRG